MKNENEKGQIFVMLVVVLIGLLAIVGLAVDTARIFIERRRVQNAVDNAAMAGSLALCSEFSGSVAYNNAEGVLNTYGYLDNTKYSITNPFNDSNSNTDDSYVFSVELSSTINPILIQIVYTGDVTASAQGVAYCKLVQDAVFNHPIYSLAKPDQCTGDTVNITAQGGYIVGGLHSNDTVKVNAGGANIEITGSTTYVDDGVPNENNVTYTDNPAGGLSKILVQDPVMPYDISEFQPGQASGGNITVDGITYAYYDMSAPSFKTGQTVRYSAFVNAGYVDGSGNIIEAVYYTDESFTLDGLMLGKATFVAEESVSFSGNNSLLAPLVDGILMAFANNNGNIECSTAGIAVSGSDVALNGMLFAPNGNVRISGALAQLEGLIVALTIDISGNQAALYYNPAYEPPPPPTVEITQ